MTFPEIRLECLKMAVHGQAPDPVPYAEFLFQYVVFGMDALKQRQQQAAEEQFRQASASAAAQEWAAKEDDLAESR